MLPVGLERQREDTIEAPGSQIIAIIVIMLFVIEGGFFLILDGMTLPMIITHLKRKFNLLKLLNKGQDLSQKFAYFRYQKRYSADVI